MLSMLRTKRVSLIATSSPRIFWSPKPASSCWTSAWRDSDLQVPGGQTAPRRDADHGSDRQERNRGHAVLHVARTVAVASDGERNRRPQRHLLVRPGDV